MDRVAGTSSGADFPHLEPTQLRQKAIGIAVVHLKSRAESCPASSTFVCCVHLLGTDCVLGASGVQRCRDEVLSLNCTEAKRDTVTTITVGSQGRQFSESQAQCGLGAQRECTLSRGFRRLHRGGGIPRMDRSMGVR